MKKLRPVPQPLCVALLALLLLNACGKQDAESPSTSVVQPLELISSDLIKPEFKTLNRSIPFTGTLQAKLRTSIQAQTTGSIVQINANNGDRVSKGQTLLRINNQDDQARLIQAQANYTATKAQADLSQNLAERNKRLFQQGFIAQIEYERSKADARAQHENLGAQQALVNIAKKAADDATVTSPISGIVSNRQVQIGQTVASGQTLFEVVDPTTIELQGSVPDNNQTNLKVGQLIEFQFAGQTKPVFSARISRINPIADAASRALLFYADVNNSAASLNIGNYVQGSITLAGSTSGLVIPLAAMWQRENQSAYVWVIRQQKLTKVKINILMQDDKSNTALIEGIEPTDQLSLIKLPDDSNGRSIKITGQSL